MLFILAFAVPAYALCAALLWPTLGLAAFAAATLGASVGACLGAACLGLSRICWSRHPRRNGDLTA